MKRAGRRRPYTEREIGQLRCVRCGALGVFQWNACADGNLWRPICLECDVALNLLVLTWLGDPDAEAKVAEYARKKRAGVKVESFLTP